MPKASSDDANALSSTSCSLYDPFLPRRLLQRSAQPWDKVWLGGRMLLQITDGSWVKSLLSVRLSQTEVAALRRAADGVSGMVKAPRLDARDACVRV